VKEREGREEEREEEVGEEERRFFESEGVRVVWEGRRDTSEGARLVWQTCASFGCVL